jgi:hypothetical protein
MRGVMVPDLILREAVCLPPFGMGKVFASVRYNSDFVVTGCSYPVYDTNTGAPLGFFPHSTVPSDILAETPDPSTWPSPKAFWASSSCRTSAFFNSLSMVFDITLCGDWAGATYNSAGYSGSCAERVADPANFESGPIYCAIPTEAYSFRRSGKLAYSFRQGI